MIFVTIISKLELLVQWTRRSLLERKKEAIELFDIFDIFDGNPWFHPSGIGLDVIELRYSGKSDTYLCPDGL